MSISKSADKLSLSRPPYNPVTVLEDIKAALTFLHRLGLVHDDVNPRNIMIDEDGRGILIDFDSCRPIGSKSKGGTPGWGTFPKTAEIENDQYGLDLVEKFMRGEYDGNNVAPYGL